MNLLQIRDKARRLCNITNTTTITNGTLSADINTAYNLLCNYVVELNEDFFEQQKVQNNLVANTALYSLPADFLKLKQVRVAYSAPTDEGDYKVATSYDPTGVTNVDIDEEEISTSNPVVDITNTKIRIKPTPDTNVTNGYELYYIARPTALVATGDIPVLQLDWHHLMSIYPAKEACSQFGDWNRYSVLEREWEKGIDKMKKALASRDLNRPLRFKNPIEQVVNRKTTELWG